MSEGENMQFWKPIATAPKDATQVLLCQAKNADGTPISPEGWGLFVQVAAWWGEEGDGEWTVYCSLPTEPQVHFTPTHWAPLPAPPAEATHG